VNVLSIQSHVVYGHVGNSAAVFALQRLGIEAWPVDTLQLSNHRGYDTARGQVFASDLVRELVRGLGERGVLARCDAALSGYLGSIDLGQATLEAVAAVKRANPDALYGCDPVIGDVGRGVYVAAEIAEFIRERAVPAADVLTPNHFELERLADAPINSLPAALKAIDELRRRGSRVVLVTSLATDETPRDVVDLVACDAAGRYRLRTPRLPTAVHGAGDTIAALFLAHYLRSRSAAEALSLSASSVFGVLQRTAAAGAQEMLLIEAQDELVKPSTMFRAEPL
jgi:pyridoxine kinase